MIREEQVQEVVAKVLRRLVSHRGAIGDKGELIVVFSAATVEFWEAIQQVRALVLNGFRVRLAFSPAAEHLLYPEVVRQMDGFPHVSMVEAETWLAALKDARAVVVPLLSLSTLSKLSMLIADNTAMNILLHALLMGKPVVAARNGADPFDRGRKELGFHKGKKALNQAIVRRLQTAEDYGCVLTDIRSLGKTLNSLLDREGGPGGHRRVIPSTPPVPAVRISDRFITASDVLHAVSTGKVLSMEFATGMTPLARDLARRHGVVIMTDKGRSF